MKSKGFLFLKIKVLLVVLFCSYSAFAHNPMDLGEDLPITWVMYKKYFPDRDAWYPQYKTPEQIRYEKYSFILRKLTSEQLAYVKTAYEGQGLNLGQLFRLQLELAAMNYLENILKKGVYSARNQKKSKTSVELVLNFEDSYLVVNIGRRKLMFWIAEVGSFLTETGYASGSGLKDQVFRLHGWEDSRSQQRYEGYGTFQLLVDLSGEVSFHLYGGAEKFTSDDDSDGLLYGREDGGYKFAKVEDYRFYNSNWKSSQNSKSCEELLSSVEGY